MEVWEAWTESCYNLSFAVGSVKRMWILLKAFSIAPCHFLCCLSAHLLSLFLGMSLTVNEVLSVVFKLPWKTDSKIIIEQIISAEVIEKLGPAILVYSSQRFYKHVAAPNCFSAAHTICVRIDNLGEKNAISLCKQLILGQKFDRAKFQIFLLAGTSVCIFVPADWI